MCCGCFWGFWRKIDFIGEAYYQAVRYCTSALDWWLFDDLGVRLNNQLCFPISGAITVIDHVSVFTQISAFERRGEFHTAMIKGFLPIRTGLNCRDPYHQLECCPPCNRALLCFVLVYFLVLKSLDLRSPLRSELPVL